MPRELASCRPALVLAIGLAFSFVDAGAQTAFRFSQLALRDPHTYAFLPFLGCRDITDAVPLGLGTPFNGLLQDSIEMDGDGDGSLDLNALIYFVPQDIAVGTAVLTSGTQWNPEDADGELIFHFGACTPPFTDPICRPDVEQAIHRLAYANDADTPCLGEIPGTRNPTYASPTWPISPCFASEPFDMLLAIGSIPVPLIDVQLGATYQGTVPPRLVDGLIRGFLREATADSVILPASIAIVGGQPLSTLLPGGAGSCTTFDDRDVYLGDTGWWVYLDFEADEVPFTPVTAVPEGDVASVGRIASLTVAPNPSAGRVVFGVTAPVAAGIARLGVYDVRGRRVRSLGTFVGEPGSREIAWDGTDARGRTLASGVYFVRLETDARTITRKVVRTD